MQEAPQIIEQALAQPHVDIVPTTQGSQTPTLQTLTLQILEVQVLQVETIPMEVREVLLRPILTIDLPQEVDLREAVADRQVEVR